VKLKFIPPLNLFPSETDFFPSRVKVRSSTYLPLSAAVPEAGADCESAKADSLNERSFD